MKHIYSLLLVYLFLPFNVFSQTEPKILELGNNCIKITYENNTKHFKVDNNISTYYLKPSGLGEFMIYNNNSELLYADNYSVKFLEGDKSNKITWKIIPKTNSNQYYLQSNFNNKKLSIDNNFFNMGWLTGTTFYKLTSKSSDAILFDIKTISNCNKFPEAEVNAIGQNHSGPNSDGTVWGIADVHNHPISYGLGDGYLNAGKVFSPFGIKDALGTCKTQHGQNGTWDVFGQVFNEADPMSTALDFSSVNTLIYNHSSEGFPNFQDYPRYDDVSHQKNYYKWLERARLGGLRLMTILTESNSAISSVLRTVHNGGTRILSPELKVPSNRNYSGSEAFEVDIKHLRDLVNYIDAQEGGVGKGWLKIVQSPAEAREEINKGNLVVVVGLEIPDLLDCIEGTGVDCSEEYIKNAIKYYKSQGVSVVFPTHHWDNDFGGANIFGWFNELGNVVYNKHTFTYQEANEAEPGHSPILFEDLDSGALTEPVKFILNNLFGITLPVIENYDSDKKYVNALGLTAKGNMLINSLIENGIMIDLAHGSEKQKIAVEKILDKYDYPYLLTHNDNYEYYGERVYSRKGLISPRINDFADTYHDNGNCKYMTSEDFLKANLKSSEYAEQYLGVKGSSFTTDFFGTLFGVAPRFNSASNPCGSSYTNKLTYPFKSLDGKITFTKQKTGDREFDFNTDGMAHYGLLPDLIEDLRVQGLPESDIDVLFKGAEAYLRVWEASEQGASNYNLSNPNARESLVAELEVSTKGNENSQEIEEVMKQAITTSETIEGNLKETVDNEESPSVYPTLVDSEFTIEDKEQARELTVFVHDISGKEIFKEDFRTIENQKFDVLDKVSQGTYLISIIDREKNTKYVFRLIKK